MCPVNVECFRPAAVSKEQSEYSEESEESEESHLSHAIPLGTKELESQESTT
jgi:hypothetical protein